ncbi:hypothetical protein HERIO_397 [Hepatospora eriocheir]|uniref:Uncharacterized protein n=1 Tax=Hepatospora eriocheir TaxID=1081669 RepID=A0A1X0QDN7_9MICR|nr:hypothetical protein HERIO_397 [Hepatospora eriocheir]
MYATQIKGSEAVINWTNFIRLETHDYIMSVKLGGEGKVVQIAESLFRGRQKYNRGRLLLDDFMKSLDDAFCKNNYGERVNEPWVFGMAEEGSRNFKMFVMEKRDRDSLLPLLL